MSGLGILAGYLNQQSAKILGSSKFSEANRNSGEDPEGIFEAALEGSLIAVPAENLAI